VFDSNARSGAIAEWLCDARRLVGPREERKFAISEYPILGSPEMDEPQVADVVIITALPEEFEAVIEAASRGYARDAGVDGWRWFDEDDDYPYSCGVYQRAGHPSITIAVAVAERMGGDSAAPLASVLCERLKPGCLAMSGVCAGNPGVVALGDVVIADRTYNYQLGKRTDALFQPDTLTRNLTKPWKLAADKMRSDDLSSFGRATDDDVKLWVLERLLAGDDPRKHPAQKRYLPGASWNELRQALASEGLITISGRSLDLTATGRAFVEEAVENDLDSPQTLPFSIHVGPMASGDVVVKDGITWQSLAARGVRSVAALEMEAATIASVAYESNVPNWLVVKGVMDHADPRKDDRYKPFAARASAEVLIKFLSQRIMSGESLTGASFPQAKSPPSNIEERLGWMYAGHSAVNHFRQRSRGLRNPVQVGDFFCGRDAAFGAIRSLLRTHLGRPVVITGQPGAGKSAVIGRLATTLERDTESRGLIYHAHGVSTEDFLAALAEFLGAPNCDVNAIYDCLNQVPTPIFLLVDALDECITASETHSLANALTELSRHPAVKVVVATRPLAPSDRFAPGRLLSALCVYESSAKSLIDLDSVDYRDPDALAEFTSRVLCQDGIEFPGPPDTAWKFYRDNSETRLALAHAIADRSNNNFLVAAITASSLSSQDEYVDPFSTSFNQTDLPVSIADAVDKYLGSLEPTARVSVLGLLASLRFAFDDGIDDTFWLQIGLALGYQFSRGDLELFRSSAAADFLITSLSEGGARTTRLFHQALIDHLFGLGSRTDNVKVLELVEDVVSQGGGWHNASKYLRDTALQYAAIAGHLGKYLNDADVLVRVPLARLHLAVEGYEGDLLPKYTQFVVENRHRLTASRSVDRACLLYMASAVYGWSELMSGLASWVPLGSKWTLNFSVIHRKLETTDGNVRSLASGRLSYRRVLLSGGDDGFVRVWNENGTQILDPLFVSDCAITAVAVGRLGNRPALAGGTEAGDLSIWSDSGKPLLPEISINGAVASIEFSEYGGGVVYAASDTYGIVGFDLRGHIIYQDVHPEALAVTLGRVGNSVFSAVAYRKSVVLKDLANGSMQIFKDGTRSRKTSVTVHRSASAIAAITCQEDGSSLSWRKGAVSLTPDRAVVSEAPPVRALAAISHSSGNLFAVADRRSDVHLVAPDSGLVQHLVGHDGPVTALASPCFEDEQLLASGGSDGTIRIWELDKKVANQQLNSFSIIHTSFTRFKDVLYLVAACGDGHIRVWQAGALIAKWESEAAGSSDGVFMDVLHDELIISLLKRMRALTIWAFDPESLSVERIPHGLVPSRNLSAISTIDIDGDGYIVIARGQRLVLLNRATGAEAVTSNIFSSPIRAVASYEGIGGPSLVLAFRDGIIGSMPAEAIAACEADDLIAVEHMPGSPQLFAVGSFGGAPSVAVYDSAGTLSMRSLGGERFGLARLPADSVKLLGYGYDTSRGSIVVTADGQNRYLRLWYEDLGRRIDIPTLESPVGLNVDGSDITCVGRTAVINFSIDTREWYEWNDDIDDSLKPIHLGRGGATGGYMSKKPLDPSLRREAVRLLRDGRYIDSYRALMPAQSAVANAVFLAAESAFASQDKLIIKDCLFYLSHWLEIGSSSAANARGYLLAVAARDWATAHATSQLFSPRQIHSAIGEIGATLDHNAEAELSLFRNAADIDFIAGQVNSYFDSWWPLIKACRVTTVARRISNGRGASYDDVLGDILNEARRWYRGRDRVLLVSALEDFLEPRDARVSVDLLPYQILSAMEVLRTFDDVKPKLMQRLMDALLMRIRSLDQERASQLDYWVEHSYFAEQLRREIAI
jgi:nucleoside phosphorylase